MNELAPGTMSNFEEPVIKLLADRIAEAEFMGCLAADLLESLGFQPNGHAIPLSYALAIGCAARLECWEQAGLKSLVAADLPLSAEVHKKLNEICEKSPERLKAWSWELYAKVCRAWSRHTARFIPKTLDAEFAVLPGNNDLAIDDLANLLWRFRELADSQTKSF
ncbi:MAG: hypothetical protein AAGF31_03135 [Planctomycetota bacterium]